MTFIHLLRSEWTKLRTTKSFWWISSVLFGLVIGLELLTGWGIRSMMAMNGDEAVAPMGSAAEALPLVSRLGFIIVTIGAVMVVTAEYRHNYAPTTFLATPHRWVVLIAKTVLYMIIIAVQVFLLTVLAVWAYRLSLGSTLGANVTFAGDEGAMRALKVYPLMAALLVPFAIGFSAMVRHTAGASILLVLWSLLAENLIMMLPRIGAKISAWLPFNNFNAFLEDKVYNVHLTSVQSLWYYIAWAVGMLLLGCIVVSRRDA